MLIAFPVLYHNTNISCQFSSCPRVTPTPDHPHLCLFTCPWFYHQQTPFITCSWFWPYTPLCSCSPFQIVHPHVFIASATFIHSFCHLVFLDFCLLPAWFLFACVRLTSCIWLPGLQVTPFETSCLGLWFARNITDCIKLSRGRLLFQRQWE